MRLHSTTRPRSTRPAPCVIPLFMAPTRTVFSSSRRRRGDEMNRKLHTLGTWLPRLVLAGMGLFGPALLAQDVTAPPPTTDGAQAPSPATSQKQTPPATKKTDESRQPILGVAVDSARKSDVLATWVTTEHNPGETTSNWIVKQSGEFGGRITDFTGNPGTWDSMVNLGSGP